MFLPFHTVNSPTEVSVHKIKAINKSLQDQDQGLYFTSHVNPGKWLHEKDIRIK